MGNATATLTLTEFLLARIAEDEADAEANRPTGRLLGPRERYARRVAECEAKRRIVELLAPVVTARFTEVRPRDTLRHLAAVYADHPDYRDEWRV